MEPESNQSSSDVLNLKQVHEQTLQAKKEKRKEYGREYQRQLRKTPAHKAKEKLRKSQPAYRAKEKLRKSQPEYKEQKNKLRRIRRSDQDQQAKEKLRKSQPSESKQIEEQLRKQREYHKKRSEDPVYRESRRQYQRQLRQTSEYQAKEKIRKSQPEYKEQRCKHEMIRRSDPDHQAKEKLRKSQPKYKKQKQEWMERMKLLRQGGVIASQSGRIGIPQNKLLEYLNLSQDLPFAKTGVNIQTHLRSLSLPNLIKSFPAVISDKFLKRKSYWIYVLVAVNWKETRNLKTMAEVEELIRSEANNKNKTIYIYVGLNSCGRMANKYHSRIAASTPNKFHKKGFRVFEAHFLNCNVGCLDLKKMSGQQLHAEILKQETFMRHLEAFMIRYGDTRNGLQFSGMRQELMNKRMEPLTKTEAKKADQLAATKVEMFNFDPQITKPQLNPATLFAAALPFKLLKELKFHTV